MDAILSRLFPRAYAALVAQFLRFGVVGTLGFVVDTAVVYALRGYLGLYGARAVSFAIAVTFSWALNRAWTFRGRGTQSLYRQWALFVAANSGGAALNIGTYVILVATVPVCAANPIIPVGAGAIAGMFVNFAFSRFIVFHAPRS